MSDNSPNVIIVNRQSILRLSIIIGIMVLSNVVRAAATPATFEYSDLSVLPQEVLQGEEVIAKVTVENVGDETGSHTADLMIDGQLEDSTDLTLGAGDQITVIFQFTADMEEGSHTATLGELTTTFRTRTLPTPATFEYSDLSVLPQEILQGEEATTKVTVKNVGDETGSHTVDLMIDGQLEDSTDLTLGAGDQIIIVFQFTADMEEGSHTATLGELTTTFAIQKEPMKLPVFTIATISIIIVIVIAYLARTRII